MGARRGCSPAQRRGVAAGQGPGAASLMSDEGSPCPSDLGEGAPPMRWPGAAAGLGAAPVRVTPGAAGPRVQRPWHGRAPTRVPLGVVSGVPGAEGPGAVAARIQQSVIASVWIQLGLRLPLHGKIYKISEERGAATAPWGSRPASDAA